MQIKKITIIIFLILFALVFIFFFLQKYKILPHQVVTIEQAILENLAVKCSYNNIDGNKVDFLIKDGKSKTITYESKSTNYSINSDGWIYFWNSKSKEGVKYQFIAGTRLVGDSKPKTYIQDPNLKADKTCVTTKIDDSYFLPPSEINFD